MAEIGTAVASTIIECVVDSNLEKTLQHIKERERAKETSTNAEKIVQPVEEWLNDVERVICIAQQMNVLNNNNKFKPFSHHIQLSSMNYFFLKDFLALNSKKPIYEELLKAIQDQHNLNQLVHNESMIPKQECIISQKFVHSKKLRKNFDTTIPIGYTNRCFSKR
ncbi:hypothetical protein JHK82_024618 [Glycine max]|nr:hypothetical protein JHK82_024618 [Glycine max]